LAISSLVRVKDLKNGVHFMLTSSSKQEAVISKLEMRDLNSCSIYLDSVNILTIYLFVD
jgi:hypothetical protein